MNENIELENKTKLNLREWLEEKHKGNLSKIEDSISSFRTLNRNFVHKVLNGSLTIDDVHDLETYEMIYKIRHDSIHWLICQYRSLPFGERKISDLFMDDEKITSHKYWYLIKNQTPDIVERRNKIVKISEVTVTRSKLAEGNKVSKYSLLVKTLSDLGYTVDLEVIIINTIMSIPDRSSLKLNSGLSDDVINSIYKVVRCVDNTLIEIHKSPKGLEWRSKFIRHDEFTMPDTNITTDQIFSYYDKVQNKPFNSIDDLKSILESKHSIDINDDENKFIDYLVDKADKLQPQLAKNQSNDLKELTDFHETHANTKDVRPIFPLPYIEHLDRDSARRITLDDEKELTSLLGYMINCTTTYLRKIAECKRKPDSDEYYLFKIYLDEQEKSNIALDGPGRKKYSNKQQYPLHKLAQEKRRRYWINLNKDNDKEIRDISYILSELNAGYDFSSPSFIAGLGLDYIRICQSIFREVNINAMRKNRRHKFLLKPTGVTGVFVLLFPGPKLRTGENLSTIWFKVILLKDHFRYNTRLSTTWIFRKFVLDGDILQSGWISTDANRLDHYIRCYDKILMAYASYQMYSGSIITHSLVNIGMDNTLGIIMMIYMEDKRSTSKMIQDSRYLVMTSLSMYKYWQDVLNKFKEPLRSPLQAYLLSKMMAYSQYDENIFINDIDFGKVNYNPSSGEVMDRFSGSLIRLPRLFTDGPKINFQQILCEMYFTMLFNKNQDDPTHASFQILTKMLEGENSLNEVKKTTKLHTGFQVDDYSDAEIMINNPHKNQFSRKAIVIASKLQSISEHNKSPGGLAHKMATQNPYINKTLDEFATYKSSSMAQNYIFNKEVYVKDKTSEELLEKNKSESIKSSRESQNKRRRCIEGVIELIKNNESKSFDLIKYIEEDNYFQIFKKNQIGGVREILILEIKKRILINILESFSRLICKEDDREMLTHGGNKFSLLRDIIREIRRGDDKRLIMNYNFDKTRWGPSFMPIQFLYMFLPFKENYPDFFRFIVVSLINHSNKKCFYPEKLLRAWNMDEDNKYQHLMDKNLQNKKEKFLDDKLTYFENESNMGQGILHYTSSLFHLCVVSLRTEIYNRLCTLHQIPPGEIKDLISSDDSYTAQAIPMDHKDFVKKRILFFLKAQEVTERVMNVWTSVSKSSISLLIYEFNSLFGSNMGVHPTLFKFALASVHPQNTDSFFRMVKESYIACRQIVENGGSLELYTLANRLNKFYCESIYHTYYGGQNDPSNKGIRHVNLPYQLGIYPIMNPSLMLMFGPECRNYEILLKFDKLNDIEKRIFLCSHSLVQMSDPELYAEMDSVDNLFVGLKRIEAKVGPINKLKVIQRQMDMDWEEVHNSILKDPLLLFRKPKTIEELKIKVYLKLYQNSAAEALRSTAASIYYARVSATVSANAFIIPFEMTEMKTYKECFKYLIDSEPDSLTSISKLYPHQSEFSSLYKIKDIIFDYDIRNPLETQNLRTLQLSKLHQRIKNPIMELLKHFWVDRTDSSVETTTSYLRDWINLKASVPIIQDTYNQTIDNFIGDLDRRIRSLILILMRLMAFNPKPMKAIVFGPSSKSYDSTYLSLMQNNLYFSSVSKESKTNLIEANVTKVFDKLCFAFDYFILGLNNNMIIDVTHLIDDLDIEMFLVDQFSSIQAKKKILILLLYFGYLKDIELWSSKTHLIFHQWDQRQVFDKNRNKWFGPYKLRVQYGSTISLVIGDEKSAKIISNKTINSTINYELLSKMAELLQYNLTDFIKLLPRGHSVLLEDKIIVDPQVNGFEIKMSLLDPIQVIPGEIIIENNMIILYDDVDQVIMRTPVGILQSEYIPEESDLKNDINMNGISFYKISKIKPFSINFNPDYLSPKVMVDLLDNLDVKKPKVTDITKKRLKLTDNWDVRPPGDEFKELEEEVFVFDMSKFTKEIIEESEDDIKKRFSKTTIMDIDESTNDDVKDSKSIYESWLDPKFNFELMLTLKKQDKVYQPQILWDRIINLKYMLITSLCVNVNTLNRKTMKMVNNYLHSNYVYYAMVFTYDRIYTNTDTPSPSGCEAKIDEYFEKKFFDDDDEDL